MMFLNQSINI